MKTLFPADTSFSVPWSAEWIITRHGILSEGGTSLETFLQSPDDDLFSQCLA